MVTRCSVRLALIKHYYFCQINDIQIMKLDVTQTTVQWIKHTRILRIFFIGRDIVTIAGGCYILFINMITGEENIWRANNDENGEGVSCYNGHRTLPVFVYAEKLFTPRIFVVTYPSFEKISILQGDFNDYLYLEFTEAEFLVCLSGYPTFTFTIWNWRIGEKLTWVETNMMFTKQTLKSSYSISPVNLSQLAKGTSCLAIWYISMCVKKCIATPHMVTFRHEDAEEDITDMLWTTDNGFFAITRLGHVYLMSTDFKLDRVITWEQPGPSHSQISWYRGGLLIYGPNSILKHYKKSGEWKYISDIVINEKLKKMKTNNRDVLIGTTLNDDLLHYQNNTNTFKIIRPNEGSIDEFCLIYPLGIYFVTLGRKCELGMWNLQTGKNVDLIILESKNAKTVSSNTDYPYVGVGYTHGLLELYSVYGPNLSLMASFQLTRTEISSIKFFEYGRIITAVDMSIGEFFILEGIPGGRINIITSIHSERQVADYMLVASTTCLRLFVIFVTSDKFICGNNICRYCIVKGCKPDLRVYELANPERMYSQLYATLKPNRDRVFYATTMETKNLHQIEVKRGETQARVIDIIPSNHLMKKIRFVFDKYRVLSYAYDGLVIIRKLDDYQNIKHIFMPHHRVDAGIKKVAVGPFGKYMISLGRDDILVCTSIDSVVRNSLVAEQLMESDEYREMFTTPTIGFNPRGYLEGKSWLEVKDILRVLAEKNAYESERKSILNKFYIIRNEVQTLITKNIEGPENERMDLQTFNLDLGLRDKKIKASNELCAATRIYILKTIDEQDRVTKYLKENYWEPMGFQMTSIFGIFADIEVQNYVTKFDFDRHDLSNFMDEYREIELLLNKNSNLQLWACIPEEEIKAKLDQVPTIVQQDQGFVIDMMATDEEEEVDETCDAEIERLANEAEHYTALSGTTIHHFLNVPEINYTQLELRTIYQHDIRLMLNNKLLKSLMDYLNKEFNGIMTIKVREMTNIMERNAKLRHIISELNYFSKEQLSININDPDWKQTEMPETLAKVEAMEVCVTPYISPSEQAILDAKAAEAERIRLALLADDFKERALMTMMNGVLEIRWEDELRKEVPVPKCVGEKEPENYNEEDLRAIRAYDEAVVFLNSERERYKVILENDYGKVGNLLRESVRKFNSRLNELLLLKLKVDSALEQENLITKRHSTEDLKTITDNEEEDHLQKVIIESEETVSGIHKFITTLHVDVQDNRNQLETIQLKEKTCEKSLKKDIQDCNILAQEIIFRLYKKRPKTNVRGITSISTLVELSRCIVTKERTQIILLCNEAVDFMNAMDVLDEYVGVPNSVDTNAYAHLCKYRRMKIEIELKYKAVSMEIAEAEGTVALYQKHLSTNKAKHQSNIAELSDMRDRRLHEEQNFLVQVVLKRGYVEIPLNGDLTDYKDAIMIARKDVEDINKIVIEAGNKKIKAMADTMTFRSGILAVEWDHKKKKMEIYDLYQRLKDVDGIKLTKEVQEFLKLHARGESPDKGLTFEQEVDLIRESYKRMIFERKEKVLEIQRNINITKWQNKKLDLEVNEINVDVCQDKLEVDEALIQREKDITKLRMATLLKRTQLVKQIQANHNEILILQAELELLRLKTYPTLDYKIYD